MKDEDREHLAPDNRTYVEKYFLNVVSGKIEPKEVLSVVSHDGEPEIYPDDCIVLLREYKKNFSRGAKDPLKDKDVIILNNGSSRLIKMPVDEAKQFAALLYSLCESLEGGGKKPTSDRTGQENSTDIGHLTKGK